MKEDWTVISHQKNLSSGKKQSKDAETSRASSEESEDITLTEKSFSEPSSPVLSRKTDMITLEERTRLCSHSSYNDLTSPLIDEDEAERVVLLESPARTHLTLQPCDDLQHQESPDASIANQQEGMSSRERSPLPEDEKRSEAGVATPSSGSDHEQEQQQGNIFSRFTGKLLQKVLTSNPENRPEEKPVAQGDTSSVKTMLQALRTGVASLASSSVSSSTPSSSAPTTSGGTAAQSAFTASEEEQVFEQMKQNSKTKFIRI